MSESAPQTITAVVFDIGKVLIQWDMRALFAKLIADEQELDWFLSHVVTEQWHFQHDAGRDAETMIAERSAEYPNYAPHIRAWLDRFNETIPGPVPGSADLVKALDAAGVPLYAITNFGADTWAGFRPTFLLLDRFQDIVVSGVEQLAKPDPAIYALAAARFGHDPRRMLFIDDNAANIASARACGWQVHHFHTADQLRSDLATRGLIA